MNVYLTEMAAFGEMNDAYLEVFGADPPARLAQRLLETSDLPVEAVARGTGFCTAGNLRKHFGRALQTSPQAYRHAFQARRPPLPRPAPG